MTTQEKLKLIINELKKGKTLQEIGNILGVSRQRIEQLLRPEKHEARVRLNVFIKSGDIISKACEYPSCTHNRPSNAHHYDYKYPLEVIWLCAKHHKQLHLELKKLST